MSRPTGLNTSSTLEQLEAQPWPAPEKGSTLLVERCHALRKIPIGRMTASDLRLLIGQDIGTRFLMPLALDTLEANPLAEAEFYPGDLLCAAMRVGNTYWGSHGVEKQRLIRVASLASQSIAKARKSAASSHQLRQDIDQFLSTRDN